MARFEHQRHKPAQSLAGERDLVVVVPALKSRVNLSRIVRVAGCFGVSRIVACRPFSVDTAIARDAIQFVNIESRGSVLPVLKKLKQQDYQLVGLEQTTDSTSLFEFEFPKRCALVIGHERLGIDDQALQLLDAVTEIPVFGKPHSFNVATAATMAIYEYCRQFPGTES